MRKTLCIFLTLFLSLWLIGCGGSSNNNGGGGGGGGGNPNITISPTSANLLVGQSTQLTATVTNSTDTNVTWSVQESTGGSVAATSTGATYTAPWPVGTYHVVASLTSNSAVTATATLNVSAKVVFLEEYPAGDALPFSMTPQVGTYAPDGTLTISGIIDEKTGNPVSIATQSVTMTTDGTKGIYDVLTSDGSGGYTTDVYSANADGTNETQLTNNGTSFWPQVSFDGQQIVYMNGWDIWAMNVDGTNQHVVYSASTNGAWVYSATLSPDATKITAEIEWYPDGVTYYDGIALMNPDGTNVVALTGGPDIAATCSSGYDEMPAFTNDGTQIMFSRWCDDNSGYESMYVINTDGTGFAPLLTAASGVAHYNPIPVGDKILFQTNQDNPLSYSFEIYSMKPDGTALTRITNNSLYDGFDTWWYNSGSASLAMRKNANHPNLRFGAARATKIKAVQEHHKR